jgi:riboflavin kinase/FMN adenylyltransferase
MKIIRYPHKAHLQSPSSGQPTGRVLTIGNFDGLHRGHQALITRVRELASEQGLNPTVVTMQPLAAQYFGGKDKLTLLTPFKQKVRLLQKMGIDTGVFLNFNRSLAEMSAEDFAENILFDGLQARHIVVGDDFRFGKNRSGDFALLRKLAAERGIPVESTPSILFEGQRISSSLIRQHLQAGTLDAANAMLGRPFAIAGRVRRGRQLGRTLGMPTLNLAVQSPRPPVQGVFAVLTALADGRVLPGVASLGTNPTINHSGNPQYVLETHVFDFNGDIYGQPVEVMFMKKLRDEVKFDGLSALRAQMQRDAEIARAYLNTLPQEAVGDQ